MDIWISKLLGPIIFVLAIPMIISPKSLNKITKGFLEDKLLILISGVLAMTAGLSIINTHNIWALDWPVIITLLGWALVVGGAFRIIAPRVVHRVGDKMMDRPNLTRVVGILWGTLGLFLIYKGYF